MPNNFDRISVVYTTDGRYWIPLYVSLFSLLEVNRGCLFTFYIICEKEDAAFVENVEHLRKTFDFEIVYLRIDSSLFAKFPLIKHFTPANYYRLLVGSLLPHTLRRVYYLDCDTIVRKPLDQLFGCDLDRAVLGAVSDAWAKAGERMGIFPYFNSGVMAINLDLWRAEQIERKALAFLDTHPEKVRFVDQDVLNAILVDRWMQLPIELNVQQTDCELYPRGTAAIDPALVHYAGREKPWFYMSRHTYKADFWQVLRRTPYCNYREPDRT